MRGRADGGSSVKDPGPMMAFGLIFVVVGVAVLVPMVRHTEALRHGTRAVGVIQAKDTADGRLRVRFEVGGDPVVAALPGNTDIRMLDAGDHLRIRYDPKNPKNVAAERDIGVKPIVFGAGFAVWGLLFAGVGARGLVLERRWRKEVDARWAASAAAEEGRGPAA